MSFQGDIDQSRSLLARARQVADQLEANAAAAAKRSAGMSGTNAMQKSWMLGYLSHDAGRRIAELEAWITAHGIRLPDVILTEALSHLSAVPPRADREAASHIERGRT